MVAPRARVVTFALRFQPHGIVGTLPETRSSLGYGVIMERTHVTRAKTTVSPPNALAAVWVSMAEHFLDSETRYHIPRTALVCLNAGLSCEQARQVWRKDVAPALGWNVLAVAGEWGAWERDWVLSVIEKTRREHWIRRITIHRALSWNVHSCWTAIEKSLLHLEHLDPALRESHAWALSALAGLYFDFGLRPEECIAPQQIAQMLVLYPEPFVSIMQTMILKGERESGHARVMEFLSS